MIKKILSKIKLKHIAITLVFVSVLFNAIYLFPEVSISIPWLNDGVLHFTSIEQASLAIDQAQNPTDFSLSQIGLGFPLFHYYQHLPHLILASINQITSSFIPLDLLFSFSIYLLLVLFPVSIFWSMRRFGFNYLASGISALVCSFFSTNALYGFDYNSYVWIGSGLYTQLWAMFFLPLALSETYHAIVEKTKGFKLFVPVVLSVIVALSSLIYGYILLLSVILFAFLSFKKKEIIYRLKRLGLIFSFIAAITSYFWIPFLLNKTYLNRSIWEESFKYNSYGAFETLKNLFSGNLFDFGRFPSLTILFFLGIIAIILFKKYKEEKYRIPLVLSLFWLFLYFGRSFWGPVLNILPFSDYLHLHRFIGGFHLGAIMVIGVGGALICKWTVKYFKKRPIILVIPAIIVVLFIVLPVCIERMYYYNQNTYWKLENQKAFSDQEEELLDIRQTLEGLLPGRIYAGLPSSWGNYPHYRVESVPFYALFPQWGLDSFGYAYHSFGLSNDIRMHFDDTKSYQYNLFNIRYVLLHKEWTAPSNYFLIEEFENYDLYQLSSTGYFDLVDAPMVIYGKNSDFYYPNSKWFFSPLVELKQHPIIQIGKEPQKTFNLPVFSFDGIDQNILSSFVKEQSERGITLYEEKGMNKYSATFEAKRDCYLMLKTNYHPNWKAFVDGEPVSVLMLSPGFPAIKVSSGVHQVVFLYESSSLRSILFVMGAFLLLVLLSIERKIWKKVNIKKISKLFKKRIGNKK